MNGHKLGLFYLRQKLVALFEIGIYPITTVILAGLFAWQVYGTKNMMNDLAVQQVKRDELQTRLEQYKTNAKELSDTDRIVFGSILKRQLPSGENTFDMFTTVDAFVAETGLQLSDYAVPDGDPTVKGADAKPQEGSSIVLSATGTVSPERFNQILDMYQYEFQRFMTLISAQVSSSTTSPGNYEVTLGFSIHVVPDPVISDTSALDVQISADDKKELDLYKEKVNTDLYIDVSQQEAPIDEKYDTSESAF